MKAAQRCWSWRSCGTDTSTRALAALHSRGVFRLQEVAQRVGTSLTVVAPLEQQYSLTGGQQLHMRLGGAHQLQNASLAVALAARWEAAAGFGDTAQQRQQQLSAGVLPAPYAEGIQTCEWPGRSQVIGDAACRLQVSLCL